MKVLLFYGTTVFLLLLTIHFIGAACPPDITPCRCDELDTDVYVTCNCDSQHDLQDYLDAMQKVTDPVYELRLQWCTSDHLPDETFKGMTINIVHVVNGELVTISDSAFAGLEDSLTQLHLGWNKIATIPSNSLVDLRNLEILNFHSNKITEIADDSIPELPSLTRIVFSSNSINTIASDSFRNVPGLTRLDLGQNSLSAIRSDMFSGLTKLTSLDVTRNVLTVIPSRVFLEVPSLTYLSLARQTITTIENGAFEGLHDLIDLILFQNEITELPSGVFDDTYNLVTLDLHINKIKSICTNLFDTLNLVQYLHFGENGIEELTKDCFNGLHNVTHLYLYANAIESIPEGVFDELTKLIYLHVGNNDIRDNVPASVFSHLEALEVLYLNDIGLTRLEPDMLRGLVNLRYLYLFSNSLEELSANCFQDLGNLEYLYLSQNSELNMIGENSLKGLSKLKMLELQDCSLNTLHKDAFVDFGQTLEKLFLGNNLLTGHSFHAIGHLETLIHLNLSANSFHSLQGGLLTKLSKLKWLGLRHQKESAVFSCPGAYHGLASLEILDLDESSATYLPSNAFPDPLPETLTANLGNVFCDCHVSYLLDQSTYGWCIAPPENVGSLNSLTADDLTCDGEYTYISEYCPSPSSPLIDLLINSATSDSITITWTYMEEINEGELPEFMKWGMTAVDNSNHLRFYNNFTYIQYGSVIFESLQEASLYKICLYAFWEDSAIEDVSKCVSLKTSLAEVEPTTDAPEKTYGQDILLISIFVSIAGSVILVILIVFLSRKCCQKQKDDLEVETHTYDNNMSKF